MELRLFRRGYDSERQRSATGREPAGSSAQSLLMRWLAFARRADPSFRLKYSLVLTPIAVAFAAMLRFAVKVRGLPDHDYWGMLKSVLTSQGTWNFSLDALYVRSNEHVVVL